MKLRIDRLLVARGLAQSRERAQALVLAGKVLVNEQKVDKPGASVPEDCALRLLGTDLRYVSRGGLKLEAALERWSIDVTGRVCLDIGASTGGFTDCLLQHGAARVIAIDTGYGQLDYRLRQDPRVQLREKTNARLLQPGEIETTVAIVTMDVSFISATLVLPPVLRAIAWDGGPKVDVPSLERQLIVLVKPQFEAGREHVGKGGIVRDAAVQQAVVERVRDCLVGLGARSIESMESPVLGMEGNREFLLYAVF